MEIKKAKARENKNFLIYGNPGTGKTSSLTDLSGKTLVIDIENGAGHLGEEFTLAEINLSQNYRKELNELVNFLKSDEVKAFDNIALDSISELELRLITAIKTQDKNLIFNSKTGSENKFYVWQRLEEVLAELTDQLFSLRQKIIFIAWEELEEEQIELDLVKVAKPKLRAKARVRIEGLCDVVARAMTKNDVYVLLSVSNGTFHAKNRIKEKMSGKTLKELI